MILEDQLEPASSLPLEEESFERVVISYGARILLVFAGNKTSELFFKFKGRIIREKYDKYSAIYCCIMNYPQI